MQLETSSNMIRNDTPGPLMVPTAMFPCVSRLRQRVVPVAHLYMPEIFDSSWIMDSEICDIPAQPGIRPAQVPKERPCQKPVTSRAGAMGLGDSHVQPGAANPALRMIQAVNAGSH